jgi:hypothetical protein
VSWSNQLLHDLTLKQAKLLFQYWQASQDYGCPVNFLSFESKGSGWIDLQWRGVAANGEPTHCHIETGMPACLDLVLTKRQIDTFCFELRSEIDRAFDKPEQSPFRKA